MATRTDAETRSVPNDAFSAIDLVCSRLVAECQQGERGRFDELVALTEPRVRRLIGRLVMGGWDRDDLTQETYLRAWKSLHRFRGESGFTTWLFRIAVNVARSHRRARKFFRSLPDEAEQTLGGSTILAEDGVMKAYEQALAELSPDLRAVFVLHEAEGLSYRDIAETLGCPIGTVMSRLHRARARILDELHERLEELSP